MNRSPFPSSNPNAPPPTPSQAVAEFRRRYPYAPLDALSQPAPPLEAVRRLIAQSCHPDGSARLGYRLRVRALRAIAALHPDNSSG